MKNGRKTPGNHSNDVPPLGVAYRIRENITIVVLEGSREKFQELQNGSILIPVSSRDSAGMIEAKHDGALVRVFQRDLDVASDQVLL